MKSIFSKITFAIITLIILISCDKDINDLGGNLLGDDNYKYQMYNNASVLAYNQKTNEVQTNGLNVNQLGIYNDPFFGTTTASFVTQLQLSASNVKPAGATFKNIKVVLNIPYFTKVSTSGTVNTYSLDSIYGNKTSKFKLSIYRNGTALETTDLVAVDKIKRYFSNQDFDFFKLGNQLNDSPDVAQNSEFYFDNKELTTSPDGTVTASAPAMRLSLNSIIGEQILASGTSLNNNQDFANFYKGLYFKVEQSGSNSGCLSILDFKRGTINIEYTEGEATTKKNFVLNMTGISVNLFNQNNSSNYTSGISNPDKVNGDNNLFLKGGSGSVAIIELFKQDKHGPDGLGGPNNIPDITDIKNSGWLINEANLTFYINKSAMGNDPNQLEANRIFLYDLNNKSQILDYQNDILVSSKPNYGKNVFSGIVQKDASGNTIKYKIRLTSHIKNIINNNGTNVKLGLSVTQNINNATFGETKNSTLNPADYDADNFFIYKNSFFVPAASIINPLGIALYGSNQNVDSSKRLKLEIFYTKPN